MTEAEAKRERPCCKCRHFERCQVVSYLYSPCYETDKNGNDYHGAFEPRSSYEQEEFEE